MVGPVRRYFFDLVSGDAVAPDEEGMELPDIQSVQEEAAHALAALAKSLPPEIDCRNVAIEVRDNAGLVLTARFDFEDRTVQ
jgi:hypothetical protein